jgi:SAM-dependent methyltransferase
MLKEHLSQEHDAASRRSEIVEKYVAWIHHELLRERPTKILDLGCGPGLYASQLSRLEHECVGIDCSPASIAHATTQADNEGLRCRYIHEDIRTAEYGTGFGLVMLIYGEINVFRPGHASDILRKANCALTDNGLLLLEPLTLSAIREIGDQGASWRSAKAGLFSDEPHLYLTENFWDPSNNTATTRYFIVDASTGDVTQHAQSYQAYTDAQYRSLLAECGFQDVEFLPAFVETEDESQSDLFTLVARKKPGST